MKILKLSIVVLSVLMILFVSGCAKNRVMVRERETKGTLTGAKTPEWVKDYIESGINKVQSRREFRDVYCIIGEETGVNLQFVLAYADQFSAQQRIGAMLRTTITSEYQARVQGQAQSAGIGSPASANSAVFQQEINNVISTIVNVSYSGAMRHSDWWILHRRYDPDKKDEYTDQYTAYVLYTIPKGELNLQVASALETAVSSDSVLYSVTIEMARNILQNGIAKWGE